MCWELTTRPPFLPLLVYVGLRKNCWRGGSPCVWEAPEADWGKQKQRDGTRDTRAELKTSALGPAEQLGDLVKEGFLEEGREAAWEEGLSGLAKKKAVGMAWGREWSRLPVYQAEQRNEENYGGTGHNVG